MVKVLGKIFGGESKVKVMRLFLMNEGVAFDSKDASIRLKIKDGDAKREITGLLHAGFLKRKTFVREIIVKGKPKRKSVNGFVLNPSFPYSKEIRALIIETELFDLDLLIKRFKGVGELKFIALSGVFIGHEGSRLDSLFIIDKLNQAKFEKAMKDLEAEIGKEVTYAIFDSKEFAYRAQMFDKLIWDMFDFPHNVVFDKKQFSTMIINSGR